jgi:acetyl-CoA C-acetyltransferase
MTPREVVLCHPVRTAIGTYGGSLKDLPAPELGAAAIRETLARSGLPGTAVESLVMGNVIQAGVKMNTARQAGIAAGLPVEVPALTVNRVCGSGTQAIASAALEVQAQDGPWMGPIDEIVLSGDVENASSSSYPPRSWT